MRIIFDLTDTAQYITSYPRLSGIQRVSIEAFQAARQMPGIEAVAVYYDTIKGRLMPLDVDRIVAFDRVYAGRLITVPRWRLDRQFVRAIRRLVENKKPIKLRDGDVIFIPGGGFHLEQRNQFFFKNADRFKIYWMCYDIIPISHPEYTNDGTVYYFRNWLNRALNAKCSFFCISEFSRDRLVEYAETTNRTVRAIATPLAHELTYTPPARIRSEFLDLKNRPFVLSVGTLEIRKNHIELAEAWLRHYEEMREDCPQLVLAGRWGWHVDRLHKFLNATGHVYGKILHIPDAEDHELAWLYQHCKFTVFPSRYEGWGLPIGESLWFGKRPICFDVASHREAGENYASYADPKIRRDLETKIREAIMNPEPFKAPDRNVLRTWSDVSSQIVDVLAERKQTVSPFGLRPGGYLEQLEELSSRAS